MTAWRDEGRLFPYGWSLAWVKRRIAAHRRAAGEPERGHMAEFHAAMADQWESYNQMLLERRGILNLRILDFYRPPP